MNFKRPESVLVVLFDQYSDVLVLQRKDDPNFWQSVTGSLEDGETPLQAAYREVLEETGVDLNTACPQGIVDCKQTNQYAIRPEWRYRYAPDDFINTEHVFAAQIDSASPLVLTEHTDYTWLDKLSAIEKIWSPSNKSAVKAFVPEAE